MTFAKYSNPQNIEDQCMIFCPCCGSPKIKLATGLTIGGLAPKQYYCEECGYVGTVVMELEEDKDAKNLKTKKKKKKQILDKKSRVLVGQLKI